MCMPCALVHQQPLLLPTRLFQLQEGDAAADLCASGHHLVARTMAGAVWSWAYGADAALDASVHTRCADGHDFTSAQPMYPCGSNAAASNVQHPTRATGAAIAGGTTPDSSSASADVDAIGLPCSADVETIGLPCPFCLDTTAGPKQVAPATTGTTVATRATANDGRERGGPNRMSDMKLSDFRANRKLKAKGKGFGLVGAGLVLPAVSKASELESAAFTTATAKPASDHSAAPLIGAAGCRRCHACASCAQLGRVGVKPAQNKVRLPHTPFGLPRPLPRPASGKESGESALALLSMLPSQSPNKLRPRRTTDAPGMVLPPHHDGLGRGLFSAGPRAEPRRSLPADLQSLKARLDSLPGGQDIQFDADSAAFQCARSGHTWKAGPSRICRACQQCTTFGAACYMTDASRPVAGQDICGCGTGHVGCTTCRLCLACAAEDEKLCKDLDAAQALLGFSSDEDGHAGGSASDPR